MPRGAAIPVLAGIKKRIHVNGAVIRKNKRDGTNDPVFTVKTYKSNTYGRAVEIHGPCRLQQNFHQRLSSGAVAWIETTAPVTVEP